MVVQLFRQGERDTLIKSLESRAGQELKQVVDDVLWQTTKDRQYYDAYYFIIRYKIGEYESVEQKRQIRIYIEYYGQNMFRLEKCTAFYFHFEATKP